jgi:hypothetical protein
LNPLSIEHLILSGAVEVSGIDEETGDFLYSFTEDAKDILPELHDDYIDYLHGEILYFWEYGFLNVDDFGKANPVISVTQLVFNEEAVAKLPERRKKSLKEILRIIATGGI